MSHSTCGEDREKGARKRGEKGRKRKQGAKRERIRRKRKTKRRKEGKKKARPNLKDAAALPPIPSSKEEKLQEQIVGFVAVLSFSSTILSQICQICQICENSENFQNFFPGPASLTHRFPFPSSAVRWQRTASVQNIEFVVQRVLASTIVYP